MRTILTGLLASTCLFACVSPPPPEPHTLVEVLRCKPNHSAEVVRALIAAGAKVDVMDAEDAPGSSLMLAAAQDASAEVVQILLEAGAAVNPADESAATPLMVAALECSSAEVVRILIAAGAEVRAQHEILTPLLCALLRSPEKQYASAEIVELLLKAGADRGEQPESLMEGFGSYLDAAALLSRSPEVVEVLIKAGADVNDWSSGGSFEDVAPKMPKNHPSFTLLLAVMANPSPEVVRVLIRAGAEVNVDTIWLTGNNLSPLMAASLRGTQGKLAWNAVFSNALRDSSMRLLDEALRWRVLLSSSSPFSDLVENRRENPEIDEAEGLFAREAAELLRTEEGLSRSAETVVRILIEAGAEVDARNADGHTALMLAAQYNASAGVARALTEAGAEVDARNAKGHTVLMLAAEHSPSVEMLNLLIQAGADVNAHNKSGQSPLSLAVRNFMAPEVGCFLVEAGAEVDDKVLRFATAYNPSAELMGALLGQSSIDLDARDEDGLTLLMLAAKHNSSGETAIALIEAGAEVNASNDQGLTSLILAVQNTSSHEYSPGMVSALIQAGAEVNARDKEGRSPLLLAMEKHQSKEILLALIQGGADVNLKPNQGETPWIRLVGHFEQLEAELVTAMIAGGADLEACDENGRTLLMLAAQRKQDLINLWMPQEDLVHMLVEAGAK